MVELNDGPARPRPKNDVDFSKKDPYTEQELNTLFSNSSREEKLSGSSAWIRERGRKK